MIRFRWLSNLFGTAPSRKDTRRPSAQQQRGVRLNLEQLEDRVTPSQTAGLGALLPATEINVMALEYQIVKQIQYFQFWNTFFQQNQGIPLPGFNQTVQILEAGFPNLVNLALQNKL